jgi:predicted secreted Zn-dependent protease
VARLVTLGWAAAALALHPNPCAGQGGRPAPVVLAEGALRGLGLHWTVTEQRYPVSGRRTEDVMRYLRFKGPLGSGHQRAHGLTTYHLGPRWLPVRESDRCVIRDARVEATVIIQLPLWTRAGEASEHDRWQWSAFLTQLVDHEHGHRDLTLRAATALAISIRRARAPTCPRLVRLVAGLVHGARASLENDHTALDSAYRRHAHR